MTIHSTRVILATKQHRLDRDIARLGQYKDATGLLMEQY